MPGWSSSVRVGFGISVMVVAACGKSSPSGPSRASLDGLYTLAIESDCAALPPHVRARTYVASIAGTAVSLSGATFFRRPSGELLNTFSIAESGDTVTLSIGQRPSVVWHHVRVLGERSGVLLA